MREGRGEGAQTAITEEVCVVLVLYNWFSATLEYLAAVLDMPSYF
jgi:hypothetical protein